MPHGLVGLLLAAVLAATMSTHSGAINSLAAASTHDIYLPLTERVARRSADARSGGSSRWSGASCSPAARCSFLRTPRRRSSSSRSRSPRSRTAALLGGFFLAIFWRRAIQRDAILGMSVGIVVMSVIVFAKQISAAVPAWADALAAGLDDRLSLVRSDRNGHHLFVGILSSLTHGAPLPPQPARVETT